MQHWLNRERLRNYPRLFIGLYLLALAAIVATSHGGLDAFHKPLGHDFITYWAASRLALADQAAGAYDLPTIVHTEWAVVPGIHTLNPWVYPPTFFLVVLPLALLPYFVSYGVFMLASFAPYWAAVRRIYSGPGSLPLLLGFPGVFVNFMEGQNAFLSAVLIGGALLLLPARPVLAGILIGLLTIKPHLGLLLPLALVCGRQWTALAAATVAAALFTLLSLAVLGWDTLPAFLSSVQGFPALLQRNEELAVKVPSTFAALRLLHAPEPLALAAQLLLAVPVAFATGWAWWRCRDTGLRSALLMVGSLLVTPYVLHYDLAWLALPIAWFAVHGLRHGWLPAEREILAAAWLLPLIMVPVAVGTRIQLGPLVLGALFLAIFRRCRLEAAAAQSATA